MCLQRNPAVRGAKGSRGWDWFYKAKESAESASLETAAFPENTSDTPRQKAFLDISIGSEPQGRVVIELASDLVPRASQNFLDLCQGVDDGGGETIGYKGTKFHTNVKNFIVQGGDVDGEGGRCAPEHSTDLSGRYFVDENLSIPHSAPGIVSMASPGVDENGSQFFIALRESRHLDAKHQVIGHVVEGMDVVKAMNETFTVRGKPLADLVIDDAGTL
jgi:cyclophilin family peptidyl-prolyl cis-trans isomerase|eukprot:Stramenopile-MAST_4_protein_1094